MSYLQLSAAIQLCTERSECCIHIKKNAIKIFLAEGLLEIEFDWSDYYSDRIFELAGLLVIFLSSLPRAT